MARGLKLSKDISLPLDVITNTIAILAKRRAGKSYTMRKLVEQLLEANQQVVLVDPKGDQWGIRSSADGKRPGFPIVILGGEHGDAPLEVSAGEVVAKLVVEERVSVLLDLSQFRKHEVATFMTAFLENLYRLKAKEAYRTPVMLVIDEADAIAPQKPQKGEERMLGAAEDIVRRGGQRGIGCALITQRSAVLNKNVLTQAQMLIVLRTIAPQDLAAMRSWIEVHGTLEEGKELMESLPSLPVGDAWFWSPGWPTAAGIFKRSHILPIETFDSGDTPAPGQKKIVPKNLADVDLDALKKQMTATIEKAKADDPKLLKKRIAELEAQKGKSQVVAAPTDERAIQRRIDEAVRAAVAVKDEELFRWQGEWLKTMDTWFSTLKTLGDTMQEWKRTHRLKPSAYKPSSILGGRSAGEFNALPPENRREIIAPLRIEGVPAKIEIKSIAIDGEVVIGKPEQRVLDAVAWMNSIGIEQPNKNAVALVARYSPTSSSYTNACGALRSKGFVDYPGGDIVLTDAGRARAADISAPATREEMQSRILSFLGTPERRVLKPLIDVYPASLNDEELGSAALYSPTSSSFTNAKGKLRTFGLIEYPAQRQSRATDILFP